MVSLDSRLIDELPITALLATQAQGNDHYDAENSRSRSSGIQVGKQMP